MPGNPSKAHPVHIQFYCWFAHTGWIACFFCLWLIATATMLALIALTLACAQPCFDLSILCLALWTLFHPASLSHILYFRHSRSQNSVLTRSESTYIISALADGVYISGR